MIIKLFEMIGVVVAWLIFIVCMGPLVIFAVILIPLLTFAGDDVELAVNNWTWPDRYTDFLIKLTGVKV